MNLGQLRHLWIVFSLLVVGLVVGLAAAQNWPQARTAEDPRLPERWSATENIVWKTEVPGTGWSSPVVVGDRIFLTSVVSSDPGEAPKKGLYFGGERPAPKTEHRWMVYAVDFSTGKILWEKEAFHGVPAQSRHLKNSYASETPGSDGERLYVYFGNIGLFCYDLKGKLLWEQHWEPHKTRYGWGTAASPVVYKGRLYIVNDNDEQSYLMALDAKTGKTVWKVDRAEASNWATPFIWENEKRTEIVTSGTKKVRSYSLEGKLLWEFSGMSSIAIPTPFSQNGLLYMASGYVGDQNRPVYVIRPGASGDITLPKGESSSEYVVWYLPQAGPYNPTPLIYGDYYYTLLDFGFFTAHEARTGKQIYGKQRLDPTAAAFTSSPWAYNGKIFALSEDGDTYVIQAGPEFKVVGKNSLDDMSMATPAIARGSLIMRTASKLYRVGKGEPATSRKSE